MSQPQQQQQIFNAPIVIKPINSTNPTSASNNDTNNANIAANPNKSNSEQASTSSQQQYLPRALVDGVMNNYVTESVSRYEKICKIGEGTYGTVYKARDRDTNEIVALKKIRMLSRDKSGFPLTSIREIKLLKSMVHHNIVELKCVCVGRKPDLVFLVFEYCIHDFASLIDKISRPFNEGEIKTILLSLLSAVDYLHSNFIFHRDLKLSNLLLNSKGELKLADFGLARAFSNPLKQYTPRVVTLWYRAPELLLNCDTYHSAVDMWSIGCIFGELLLHKPLLPGKNETEQLALICELLGTPNDKIWPGFSQLYFNNSNNNNITLPSYSYNNLRHKFSNLSNNGLNLLSRLLTYDPSKRITAGKALQHPYFTEFPLPVKQSNMPTFQDLVIHNNNNSNNQDNNHSNYDNVSNVSNLKRGYNNDNNKNEEANNSDSDNTGNSNNGTNNNNNPRKRVRQDDS